MSSLIAPTPEQWEVLRELGLTGGGGGIILLAPELNDKLRTQVLEHASVSYPPDEVDYDFGGEADTWLDVVSTEYHYAYSRIRAAYFDAMGLAVPPDPDNEEEEWDEDEDEEGDEDDQ